jgi:hypothetical protein
MVINNPINNHGLKISSPSSDFSGLLTSGDAVSVEEKIFALTGQTVGKM